MKAFEIIKSPTKKELFILRLMIFLGLFAMGLFLISVFSVSVRGDGLLYWMLIITFVYTCLRIVHEWIHYFYITVPITPSNLKTYSVDMFTTFCAGEPYEMIEETLIALQNITYPHKTFLCDESNDPYLKSLCKELGVYYVTRTDKKNAKAGNINNALVNSTGELCVVLDPDHVPLPNFLDPIISHFNNTQVGFVQIVQAYSNNEESLIAKGAAQQTYQFYGPMMMTMNKYGTVLAIGANCTFRRSALESIGGHAAGLAEDMHTAMQLHSKGWKSVYVPAVLARGLVPSTLSAYYKQQLKWSRGVFDLFFTAYPKLIKGFTWQQKLHYGIIPFHYLSGLIILINFLIPIIALFFNMSPIHINIEDFGLLILPFVSSIILIRHFVQKWVMEDKERGFHVVGGLLMIGTWWIFILGLVYTIFKKDVPYIPTPKDNNEANNWPLNIPNLVILFLSITAAIYGLWSDWNPYNLIMAGFAGMNSLFMCFNIAASRHQQFRMIKRRYAALNNVMRGVKVVKKRIWLIRHGIYAGMRSPVIIIIALLFVSVFYFFKFKAYPQTNIQIKDPKRDYFLTGLFLPDNFNGMTSIGDVKESQKRLDTHFDIVSFYIPWGDENQCNIPVKVIDSVYRNGSVPMISWEPWQNLFKKNLKLKDEKVFLHILSGEYDQYLQKFSKQIRELKRPVFIRFAHEFDNPFYPWSAKGSNTAEDFKAAWKYIHNLFKENKTYNVVWVWNPWKENSVKAYFPGKRYVDWIGVTNLNYGELNSSKKWESMEDLYEPFHRNAVFRSGLPVMLAEMGSLQSAGKQRKWFESAFQATIRRFPEIKSFIFFNSAYDKNLPLGESEGILNWNIDSLSVFSYLRSLKPISFKKENSNTPVLLSFSNLQKQNAPIATAPSQLFMNIKGMNYSRGHDWVKSYVAFTNKEVVSDFKEMKQIGVDHVKIFGPSIYDRNVLNAASKLNIKVHYSFWIPDHIDYLNDHERLNEISKEILQTVRSLNNKKIIVSWNIGNPVLQKLSISYYKPALLYQQDAYLLWLKNLVNKIKEIDRQRMISVDIEASANLKTDIDKIRQFIPAINIYGLVVNDKSGKQDIGIIKELKVPYFFSSITAPQFEDGIPSSKGVFISNWQDDRTSDFISFDGLEDYKGRSKFLKRILSNHWKGKIVVDNLEKYKILKPAKGILEGQIITYQAIVNNRNRWELAHAVSHNKKFEWKLVRSDGFNNPISMEELGEGNNIAIKIPKDHFYYKLYLYVIQDSEVMDILKTTLHTPLITKGELISED